MFETLTTQHGSLQLIPSSPQQTFITVIFISSFIFILYTFLANKEQAREKMANNMNNLLRNGMIIIIQTFHIFGKYKGEISIESCACGFYAEKKRGEQ